MNLADIFVLRNTSITRGHNFKLYKPLCNLMCESIALHTGLLIFGTACQAILFLLITFVHLGLEPN